MSKNDLIEPTGKFVCDMQYGQQASTPPAGAGHYHAAAKYYPPHNQLDAPRNIRNTSRQPEPDAAHADGAGLAPDQPVRAQRLPRAAAAAVQQPADDERAGRRGRAVRRRGPARAAGQRVRVRLHQPAAARHADAQLLRAPVAAAPHAPHAPRATTKYKLQMKLFHSVYNNNDYVTEL
ncbi:unnamed protein product [Chrysodeixis includens]|uniref:Uncharacterized protein n=1 Tax=Chrysodeixis includens TaxID=689277 RepID=A0A9N8Q1X2_CHRIL|nr:unnamed protein product [Chrysodeixis includens]